MERKNIEIIVGTNEEYVLGYRLCTGKDGKLSLEQSFADHSHNGSVRQVAVGGKFLVSGGTDEHIKIYDLNKHVEVGTLLEHEGTITYLGFHGNRYLFTAAEDGKICIFAKKNWTCEKTLKGHRAAVMSVSVHPSGKMALSLAQDQKLRTWNLIKGRKAYITHMNRIADIVKWSPCGTKYLIVKGSCIEVYNVSSCKVEHSVDFKEKVTALLFLNEVVIAVAAGDKNICLYDIAHHFEILQWEAHSLRVKSLCLITGDEEEEPWLVSASSDGVIKIWKLQLLSLTSEPELLTEVDTTCRIICMAVYVPLQNQKDKVADVIKKQKTKAAEALAPEGVSNSEPKEKKKKKAQTPDDSEGLQSSTLSETGPVNGMNKLKKKKKILKSDSTEKEPQCEAVVEHSETVLKEKKTTKKKKQKLGVKDSKSKIGESKGATENGLKKKKKKKKIKVQKVGSIIATESVIESSKVQEGEVQSKNKVKKKRKQNSGETNVPKKKVKI